jgi:hypothetical protein
MCQHRRWHTAILLSLASRHPPVAGLPPSSRRRPPAASVWLPLHLAMREGWGGASPARREVGAGRGAARTNARQGRGGHRRPMRGRGGRVAPALGTAHQAEAAVVEDLWLANSSVWIFSKAWAAANSGRERSSIELGYEVEQHRPWEVGEARRHAPK